MVKEAWGKKHTCPKCGTRFYDLGKKGPAVCIECEHKWVPEQILKSKQVHVAPPKPVAVATEAKPAEGKGDGDSDGDSNDGEEKDADVAAIKGLEVEVEDDGDEKDAGILGDVSLDDEKSGLADVVDTKLEKGGSE